jgi:hypothetical protein
MLNAYNKTNPNQLQAPIWSGSGSGGVVGHVLLETTNETYVIEITRFNTEANATAYYNKWFVGSSGQNETPIYWGLPYYTAATGHAPTVQRAQTQYVGGSYDQYQTIAQYDTVCISYAVNTSGG